MKITLRNFLLGIRDQGPLLRFIRNWRAGHLKGWFSHRSHENFNGTPKIMYNTKATAIKSAEAMGKKRGVHFSNWKCLYCNGYHIGKNSLNKITGVQKNDY
jgi:hypothetical protein